MTNPDYAALMRIADEPGTPLPLATLPLFRSLSAELRSFDRSTGRLTMGFTTTGEHVQGFGVVAGGVVGTILDFAMSLPILGTLSPGTPFATTTYAVNLIAALRPGPVVAESWIERSGTRVAFTAARIVADDTGARLIATGTSTLAIMDARPPSAG